MEIRYLEEFIELAECLNFSEAAQNLNMAQSTLSKHIQTLETETGGKLFDRSSRRSRLSELGALYLPLAKKIVEANDEAELRLQEYRNRHSASFTLAVVHNLHYFNIDRYIIGFRSACPECRMNVVEGEESELRSMFLSGQTNFFTAYLFGGEKPEYDFLPLGEGHIVAFLPEGHRLAGCPALSLSQLENESLLLPNRNAKMYRAIISAFEASGIVPHTVYAGNSISCVDLVKTGMGISLQPQELALWRPDQGVCDIDVKPFIVYRYGIGYRDGPDLTVSERKLLAYLRELSGREGFRPES